MHYHLYSLSFVIALVVFTFSFLLKDRYDQIITAIMSCAFSFILALVSLDIEYVLDDGTILTQTDYGAYVLPVFFVIIGFIQLGRIFVIPYSAGSEAIQPYHNNPNQQEDSLNE